MLEREKLEGFIGEYEMEGVRRRRRRGAYSKGLMEGVDVIGRE